MSLSRRPSLLDMCWGMGRGVPRDDLGSWRLHLEAELCQVKCHGPHDAPSLGWAVCWLYLLGHWMILAGEMVKAIQAELGIPGPINGKCAEGSVPITFTMCTKFICLRAKITFTLQEAVSVTSTDVGKLVESQKREGKGHKCQGDNVEGTIDLSEKTLSLTLCCPSDRIFLSHRSLSHEMTRMDCCISEGTFSAATSGFKKCPLLSSAWSSCQGKEMIQKPQEASQPSPPALQDHPPRADTQLAPSQSPFACRRGCGNKKRFPLPFLTHLLVCFHAQTEHIQRTEPGQAGGGRC